MAPQRRADDWSDSDEEERFSTVETDVLLGIPDGNVENERDAIDAAVSRIGGLPALLPSKEPSFLSSSCKSCSQPMELLVQIWCPFEHSPMDRAIYIWGCARAGCQGHDGSVRAWRGLRYNETYAAKLKRKQQNNLELQRQKAKSDEERTGIPWQQKISLAANSNPFSYLSPNDLLQAVADSFTQMAETKSHFGVNNYHDSSFSLGAQIFSTDVSNLSEERQKPGTDAEVDESGRLPLSTIGHTDIGLEEEKDSDDDASDTNSEAPLITALASTKIAETAWKSAPAYPPLYLSTVAEYLPPQGKHKVPKGIEVECLGDDDKKEKNITWAKETYEDSLEVDRVFERFTQRIALEAEQCIRYELGGTPLPFSSDKVFDLLWPKPAQDPLPTTKAEFKVVRPQRRLYDNAAVPFCSACKAPRIFECQLMPNLINVLRPALGNGNGEKARKITDEERRKQVEKALMKGMVNRNEKREMEWGTCMVFSCEKDCCVEDGKDVKEAWREEVVHIQWDV